MGGVIPFVIGLAYYICQFIIKAKHEGWKNVSVEEWKEFGRNIEGGIEGILGSASKVPKVDLHCEECKKRAEEMNNYIESLNQKVEALRSKLMNHVSSRVESTLNRGLDQKTMREEEKDLTDTVVSASNDGDDTQDTINSEELEQSTTTAPEVLEGGEMESLGLD